MEFPEIAALLTLVGAAVTIPVRVLLDAAKIRSGCAGEIDTWRSRRVLIGMSLVAGGSLLLLDQPWLIAAVAGVPGTAACAVIVEISEQARDLEEAK